ncbi:hypothetical protein [Pedobacter insulae]|uniref:Outer membrane protein beta-barrel domain-containing protein n=1 Tax=Pedobacter insulae TaxID=414048 RepID=A0A1I2SVA6_9SPHI|nr:hypothetical protein [Pedobacter insulae]SFG56825.1 hypothetical protein SAMN04489864_10181 [Pedobacter insulae]
MKKLLTLSILFLSLFAKAQEEGSIALSYGFGNGKFGHLGKSEPTPTSRQRSLHLFGMSYWHEIGKNLFFETGFQRFLYSYETASFDSSQPPTNNELNFTSIPFKLRFEAGDYIFFNGGLTTDLNSAKFNTLLGIGAGIGIGLQVKTFKQISLYVNPQANLHRVKGTAFLESNITFGASYQLFNH